MQRQVPPDVVANFGVKANRVSYADFLKHTLPPTYRNFAKDYGDDFRKFADRLEVSGWTLEKLAKGEIRLKDKADIYVIRSVVDEALAELVTELDSVLTGRYGSEEQRREILFSERDEDQEDREDILAQVRQIQVCRAIMTDINQITDTLRQEIEHPQKGMELG